MTADDDTLITPGPLSRRHVSEAVARLPIYLSPEELRLANNNRSIRLSQQQSLDVADRALSVLVDEKGLNIHSWLIKVNSEWGNRTEKAETARQQDKDRARIIIAGWRTLAGTAVGTTGGAGFRIDLHLSYPVAFLILLPWFFIIFYLLFTDVTKARRPK